MTIDPRRIREIARVCATLSKSAPTAEEHDVFANLALKWLIIALDRETRLAVDLDRFDDDGGQVSALPQVTRRSPLGYGNRQTKGGIRAHCTVTRTSVFQL